MEIKTGQWTPSQFKWANIIGASLCIAFALAILLGATGYAFQVQALPGPGMFPTVIGVGLLGLSVAWLGGSILGRYPVDEDIEPPPDRSALIRAVASFGIVCASAFAMQPLGYPLTIAVSVTVFTLLAGGGWRTALVVGPLFAASTFLLVTTLLGVQLPTGILRPLLITLL
ncbi:tripartite tricarboxylate transporter TctB family protein [Diaminobutyricimonas sp. TR449]|uniref:tripartite tricarboxylate transporter TctB family protein n=1 Tax=Diaminobutyricimonas sp. TR449 TaxID=2708076 RepID=UPI00141F2B5A|nr:tripartite tricarboxylate transporter TctB family protein [Diaminobutyricimonas sp. TR449]